MGLLNNDTNTINIVDCTLLRTTVFRTVGSLFLSQNVEVIRQRYNDETRKLYLQILHVGLSVAELEVTSSGCAPLSFSE